MRDLISFCFRVLCAKQYLGNIMSGEIINNPDILNGIARIRIAFQAVNLKPPTTILLESHDEGMRFLSEIRQTNQWIAVIGSQDLGKPIEMADGSTWMEVQVMGIAVRWPANRIETPDGSRAFI